MAVSPVHNSCCRHLFNRHDQQHFCESFAWRKTCNTSEKRLGCHATYSSVVSANGIRADRSNVQLLSSLPDVCCSAGAVAKGSVNCALRRFTASRSGSTAASAFCRCATLLTVVPAPISSLGCALLCISAKRKIYQHVMHESLPNMLKGHQSLCDCWGSHGRVYTQPHICVVRLEALGFSQEF